MTALTPDCDPDLSNCGSPTSPPRGGVRSTVVLLALVTIAVLAVTGEAVPGAAALLAGGVGVLSALVLARRAVRVAGRIGAAVVRTGPGPARCTARAQRADRGGSTPRCAAGGGPAG